MADLERFRRPALVVVDMQNDFVRQGAPLEVPQARDVVPLHQALLTHFRARSWPVVFLRWVSVENDPYLALLPRFEWVRHLDETTAACRPGFRRWYEDIGREADAAAVIDELEPAPGETQVDKRGYGGFLGTDLHERLQALGAESLVVTGVVAEICVEDTVRQAFQFHYRSTVVADAVASRRPDRLAAMLATVEAGYGWVSNGAEILERS